MGKKAKARRKPKPPAVIEGPVQHAPCGWVSDGAAFYEGAGCPKCGEPILADDCEEVTEGQLVEDDDDDEEEDDDVAAEEEDEDLEDEDEEDLDDEEDDEEE